ncbi:MAG: MBL fold metallo-hydrolase [Rhodospirillaceae bacterium]|jgi:glyoxylase-like metal-dependent hydrolase (beta-lactamase superfamily II)|nr:MBL fold metallo-hydrolase [Rhodospirillaceae bacterium]MBT3886935.1 MBL fold metallo-hydrolase [Rhodospirillaceae bacterium]MBT4116356.1 MBL fold metallo-hydrolase [Rhodospirillaceae bacterium]MBT4672306.1 MBL fold metallo-hydrolase [Rhodospirillaceae bacterium]MBT4720708.1 MBL fold metallo-hydrolase [Rhodospirillaceae bacterium]
MQAAIMPVTPFQQNCSLLWCTETMQGAVVDPGGEVERIIGAAAEHKITIEKILITHGHIDHAGGAAELAERCGCPIEGPEKGDAFWIGQLEESGEKFGFDGARIFEPTRWLQGGDDVTFGNVTLAVRHCPGHTPGHVVFVEQALGLAIVGDVLFQGSIGRTDFPRGDHATLIRSITEQLWPLGNEVAFIPGHGQVSTFGAERENNPFVSDAVLAG